MRWSSRWTASTSPAVSSSGSAGPIARALPTRSTSTGTSQLLDRLRRATSTVYAPEFRRDLEEPIAGAIAVEAHHTTVITEGNYLLLDCGGWERVRPLLTECWFVECDEAERITRLVDRHVAHGRSPDAARRWVEHTDEPNARLIEATRPRADRGRSLVDDCAG